MSLYFTDEGTRDFVNGKAKEVISGIFQSEYKTGRLVGRLAYGSAWTIITRGPGIVVSPTSMLGDIGASVETQFKANNLSFEAVFEKTVIGH